jgi:hypothetical protein
MIAGASNEATVLFWSDMGVKDCSGSKAVWRYPLAVDGSDDKHCTRPSEHDCFRIRTCVVHVRHELAFSLHYESAVPMFHSLCACSCSAPEQRLWKVCGGGGFKPWNSDQCLFLSWSKLASASPQSGPHSNHIGPSCQPWQL